MSFWTHEVFLLLLGCLAGCAGPDPQLCFDASRGADIPECEQAFCTSDKTLVKAHNGPGSLGLSCLEECDCGGDNILYRRSWSNGRVSLTLMFHADPQPVSSLEELEASFR